MFWNMNQRLAAGSEVGDEMHQRSNIAGQTRARRTGDLERGEVTEILAVDVAATKDINDISDDGRRVALASDRQVADALELGPLACLDIVRPRVVVMKLAVGPAKQKDPVLKCDADVAGSRSRWVVDRRDAIPARSLLRLDCGQRFKQSERLSDGLSAGGRT